MNTTEPNDVPRGHQESNRSHRKAERQLQHYQNLVMAVRGIYARCQRRHKNGTLIWGLGGGVGVGEQAEKIPERRTLSCN